MTNKGEYPERENKLGVLLVGNKTEQKGFP